MVTVKLVDVFSENSKKDFFARKLGQKGTRWYSTIALHLIDESSNNPLAEWFYLVLCSPEYLKKPFIKGPKIKAEERYVVVQAELDMEKALEVAKKKINSIEAEDWKEFYKKMGKEFLHEE